MTFLLLSFGLVVATFFLVRPAVVAAPPLPLKHFNGIGVIVLFVALLAPTLLFGVEFALALLAAWLLKQLGHVLGYRLAGHADARMRLVPLPGGPAISDRPPASDLAAFFIALMGPGLSLAPMVAAFALGDVLAGPAPAVAHAARSFALASGALNFLALLPVRPFDGGRLAQFMIRARFPNLGGLAAAALTAFMIGLSFTTHSALLFLLGAVGGLALVFDRRDDAARATLTRAQVRIGFLAYLATLSAYFLCGWWVLRLLPSVF